MSVIVSERSQGLLGEGYVAARTRLLVLEQPNTVPNYLGNVRFENDVCSRQLRANRDLVIQA